MSIAIDKGKGKSYLVSFLNKELQATDDYRGDPFLVIHTQWPVPKAYTHKQQQQVVYIYVV